MSEVTAEERCFWCDSLTGKAGRADDSLYLGDIGPFCEECWEPVRELENDAEFRGNEMQSAEIERLREENARLNPFANRAAERMATAIHFLVLTHKLDSRSEASDAALDWREPNAEDFASAKRSNALRGRAQENEG